MSGPAEGRSAAAEPVEVPVEALGAQALAGLLEEFVTRDGTDYGRRERTVEEKVRDVRRQLARGEARIVFDPATGTANVVVASAPRRRQE